MPAASAVAIFALGAALSVGEADDRAVQISAVPVGEFAPAETFGGLDDGDVLVIHVLDGVPDARGTVQQCDRGVVGSSQCSNAFPVLFDDEGVANFQYQLDDPGRCGATGSCAVVVGDADGEREAVAFLVFGDEAPPEPAVTLAPAGPYDGGEEVGVVVGRLQPGTPVEAAFCRPSCGPTRRSEAGADGTATLEVVVGDRCDRCGIAVVGGGRSSLVRVEFNNPPTAVYESPRLVAGLLSATVFLVLAWRIVAVTEWSPPSEARTPELELPDAS